MGGFNYQLVCRISSINSMIRDAPPPRKDPRQFRVPSIIEESDIQHASPQQKSPVRAYLWKFLRRILSPKNKNTFGVRLPPKMGLPRSPNTARHERCHLPFPIFPQIALAIGALTSNRRGGWLPTLAGFTLCVPCWGAIAGCHAGVLLGAIAGCHCGVPWLDAIVG